MQRRGIASYFLSAGCVALFILPREAKSISNFFPAKKLKIHSCCTCAITERKMRKRYSSGVRRRIIALTRFASVSLKVQYKGDRERKMRAGRTQIGEYRFALVLLQVYFRRGMLA